MRLDGSKTGRWVDHLTEHVNREWPGWFGTDAPRFEWVLESTGRHEAQTSVMLYAVGSSSGEPLIVAKVNRHRRFGSVVEHEFNMMSEACFFLGPEAPETIARPLGLVNISGDIHLISVFARAALSWEAATADWRAEKTGELAEWLAVLHQRSERSGTAPRGDDVEQVISTFVELFEPPTAICRRLEQAGEFVVDEFRSSGSEILLHGDFWPGNWRFDAARFTIIDWEHARWSPSPLIDEFLFPLSRFVFAVSHGIAAQVEGDLMSFSDAYRQHRGIPLRTRAEGLLASIWNAAEVATRSHRRWGVVEDWSLDWRDIVPRLSTGS